MHVVVIVLALLAVVAIFGISSSAQSYATAEQAHAMQEVARVAQMNAWGNLITLLSVAVIVIVVIAILAAVAWILVRRAMYQAELAQSNQSAVRSGEQNRQLDPGQALTALATMMLLDRLQAGEQARYQLPERVEDEDPLSWLKLEQ